MASIALRHESRLLNLKSHHTLFNFCRLYSSSSSNNDLSGLIKMIENIRLPSKQLKEEREKSEEKSAKQVVEIGKNLSKFEKSEEKSAKQVVEIGKNLSDFEEESEKSAKQVVEIDIKSEKPAKGRWDFKELRNCLELISLKYEREKSAKLVVEVGKKLSEFEENREKSEEKPAKQVVEMEKNLSEFEESLGELRKSIELIRLSKDEEELRKSIEIKEDNVKEGKSAKGIKRIDLFRLTKNQVMATWPAAAACRN